MNTKIIPIFCNDNNMANYAYLITEENSQNCIIIDAAEARPIIAELQKLNLTPTHILTTHHHFDHVGGNLELKQKYQLEIISPKNEFMFVPGADKGVAEGDTLNIENFHFDIIQAPGHTLGHILYYLKSANALFTGDVLFNLSVGGLFEGTPEQMHASLNKIQSLPNSTFIFPGHEYTRAGITQDLLNQPDFAIYLQKMQSREEGFLAPSTLAEEKKFNPYLRNPLF